LAGTLRHRSLRLALAGTLRSGSLRLALAGMLLTLSAAAGMASTASATSTYDMRGEWHYSIVCSCGQSVEGSMLLTHMELTSGEYSGTTDLGGFVGTVSGTVTGASLSLVIDFPKIPLSLHEFTVSAGSINSLKNEISGSGYYNEGGSSNPTGVFTAVRTRTIEQIKREEAEARKRAEEEAKKLKEKEIEEKPLKEKAEKEAKEKLEAQEREATEARERLEAQQREATAAREKQEAKEREEKAKASSGNQSGSGQTTTQGSGSSPQSAPLASVELLTKSPSLGGSGSISFSLANTNSAPISGQLTLTGAGAGKSSLGGKTTILGVASFTIPAHGTAIVKLKLSKSARAALRHRKLRATARLVTQAGGRAAIVKTYSLILAAPRRTTSSARPTR
jgi:hypothetical protein